MMGVFVQMNEGLRNGMSIAHPIGYVIQENGCWDWVGKTRDGYGIWWLSGRHQGAHCVMYERVVGPIPTGLQLDHLCRNRLCVNPAHLEAVTSGENTRRGISFAATNARKTHCAHGHEYNETNTVMNLNGKGRKGRACLVCRSVHGRARHIARSRR